MRDSQTRQISWDAAELSERVVNIGLLTNSERVVERARDMMKGLSHLRERRSMERWGAGQ